MEWSNLMRINLFFSFVERQNDADAFAVIEIRWIQKTNSGRSFEKKKEKH